MFLFSSSFIIIMKHNTLTFTEHAPQCQGQGKPLSPTCVRQVSDHCGPFCEGAVGLGESSGPANCISQSRAQVTPVWMELLRLGPGCDTTSPAFLTSKAYTSCPPHRWNHGLLWMLLLPKWPFCWLERLLSDSGLLDSCTSPESVLCHQSSFGNPARRRTGLQTRSATHSHWFYLCLTLANFKLIEEEYLGWDQRSSDKQQVPPSLPTHSEWAGCEF